jgi:hypothetical protein
MIIYIADQIKESLGKHIINILITHLICTSLLKEEEA